MQINFFSEDKKPPVYLKRIETKKWLQFVASQHKKEIGELNIIFCSDEYLIKINQRYLNHDYFTDVITFDYSIGGTIDGDIFISVDRLKDNAKKLSTNLITETYRIIIHGLLHLLGYDDKTKELKKVMTRLEDEYLSLR